MLDCEVPMDMGVVKELVQFFKADRKEFVRLSYAIPTRGSAALATIDLDDINTLIYGLRFMLYIAVIGFLFRSSGRCQPGPTLREPWICGVIPGVNLVLWLLYATVTHFSMRLAGGKATLHHTLAVFCFLTAFFLPLMVIQWPLMR